MATASPVSFSVPEQRACVEALYRYGDEASDPRRRRWALSLVERLSQNEIAVSPVDERLLLAALTRQAAIEPWTARGRATQRATKKALARLKAALA